MKVDLQTLRSKFDAVLNGAESRESVSRWANSLREADDIGELTCIPESDRNGIWKAIKYLNGVDLLVDTDVYLHSEEDISRARPE